MFSINFRRTSSKVDSLRMLRRLGLNFGCIFDVGVQGQTQELIEVFPDLKHYLFEPVVQYLPMIRQNYAALDHEILNVAVSDRDGIGQIKLIRLVADEVTHSCVVEELTQLDGPPSDVVDVRLVRLSTLLAERAFPQPILLKIDVDGHEPAILEGLVGSEELIGAVIIESGLQDFVPRIARLQQMGFLFWDAVDPCYYKGCLAQMDLIFVSSRIAEMANLQPLSRPDPFDMSAWQAF